MNKVKVVPQALWNQMREYLEDGVLIPEDVFQSLSDSTKDRIETVDLSTVGKYGYDFGGEPEIRIDVIYGPDSYALGEILDEAEEES